MPRQHGRCIINQRPEEFVYALPRHSLERRILWNEEPGGNVRHIAEHGLTPEDVEGVVFNPVAKEESRSSGLPIVYGFTSDGRYILVVYDETTIYPVTAYVVEE